MTVVNVHEAKTHLSRLLERVEGGEEFVIARAGRPVARLVPLLAKPATRREGGFLKGLIRYAPDWDSPETNAETARLFNDGEDTPGGPEGS